MSEAVGEIKVVTDRFQLEMLDKRMEIEAWIETHPGRFSATELCEAFGVGNKFCRSVIESHPLVQIDPEVKKTAGRRKKYISMAQPLEPTPAGLAEEYQLGLKWLDKKGREAREDLALLIEERRRYLPKKYRTRISF